jgi:hypothetical protein
MMALEQGGEPSMSKPKPRNLDYVIAGRNLTQKRAVRPKPAPRFSDHLLLKEMVNPSLVGKVSGVSVVMTRSSQLNHAHESRSKHESSANHGTVVEERPWHTGRIASF